jgi:hypothetical protein
MISPNREGIWGLSVKEPKMRIAWTFVSALLAAVFLASSPVQAQKAERSPLAGWWGYDKSCPDSDDGFGLESDGRASDGSGAYDGRWSLRKDQVTIIWNATKSERPHINRSKWRIVENFRLVQKSKQHAMLVNIKNREPAWHCREY